MNVTLKPELEKFVEDQLSAGRFASAEEMFEAALARLMLDPPHDQLDAEDIAAIAESEAQIARDEDMGWKQASAQFRRKYLGEEATPLT